MQSASRFRILRRGALALLAVVVAVSAGSPAVASIQAKKSVKIITVPTTRKPVNPGGGTKATTLKKLPTTVPTTAKKTTKKATKRTAADFEAAINKVVALMAAAQKTATGTVTGVEGAAAGLRQALLDGNQDEIATVESGAATYYANSAYFDEQGKPEAIAAVDQMKAIGADVVLPADLAELNRQSANALNALLETWIMFHDILQGFQSIVNGDAGGAMQAIATARQSLQRYQDSFDAAIAVLRTLSPDSPLGSLTK